MGLAGTPIGELTEGAAAFRVHERVRKGSEFSQQAPDSTLKIAVYQVYRFSRVDNLKPVVIDHRVEHRQHSSLIRGEAVEQIISQVDVHAGFPVVESPRTAQHPRDQASDVRA